jgi:hypothetical protein
MDQPQAPVPGPAVAGVSRQDAWLLALVPPVVFGVAASVTVDLFSGRYCGWGGDTVTFADMARHPWPNLPLIIVGVVAGAAVAVVAARATESALCGPSHARAQAVRRRLASTRLLAVAIALTLAIGVPWVTRIVEREAAIALLRDMDAGAWQGDPIGRLGNDASSRACRALIDVALNPQETLSRRRWALASTLRCADADVPVRRGAEDGEPRMRGAWAELLHRSRSRHPDAAPVLERLRRDPNPRVRFAAESGVACFEGWDPRCPATQAPAPDAKPRP